MSLLWLSGPLMDLLIYSGLILKGGIFMDSKNFADNYTNIFTEFTRIIV